MKTVVFVGNSRDAIRAFPDATRQRAGFALDRLQRGLQPADFKPMPTVGPGVEELRIWDDAGTFRVIYFARMADAVYVLHAFAKKSQRTARTDVALAAQRLRQVLREAK